MDLTVYNKTGETKQNRLDWTGHRHCSLKLERKQCVDRAVGHVRGWEKHVRAVRSSLNKLQGATKGKAFQTGSDGRPAVWLDKVITMLTTAVISNEQ